jgi:ParB/RepB/Spo0J family partition protein
MEVDYKIEIVDIEKVEPNDYNPNVMDDKTYATLKRNIENGGFIGTIIVRKNLEKQGFYIIVDGEHRWKIGRELGYKKIPIVVVEKSVPEAMISTINLNKIRGEFNTLELAKVVAEINKTYSVNEIEEQLGYSEEEIEGLNKLNNFDFEKYEEEVGEEIEKKKKMVFRIILTDDQLKVVNEAVEKSGMGNLEEDVINIIADYGKSNN